MSVEIIKQLNITNCNVYYLVLLQSITFILNSTIDHKVFFFVSRIILLLQLYSIFFSTSKYNDITVKTNDDNTSKSNVDIIANVDSGYTTVESNGNHTSITNNVTIKCDSYKTTHHEFLEKLDVKYVHSYLEARSGKNEINEINKIIFFGLKPILKWFEEHPVTKEMIDSGEKFIDEHIGKGIYNRKGWEHILYKHDGKLPIVIKAILEGTEVPVSNVLLTVENTDPECAWVVGHIETFIMQVWYTCTVATISKQVKELCLKYLIETDDDYTKDTQITFDKFMHLNVMLNDFGERGVSSMESAGLGGMAHLTCFSGTDNIQGICYAKEIYGAKMPGVSVRATEHSIMTAKGESGEKDVIDTVIGKDEFVSVVLDSYNIIKAVEYLVTKYDENRKTKIVIRPDSGNPITVIGKILEVLVECAKKKHLNIQTNKKGYRKLPNNIGIIWGDGLDLVVIKEILDFLKSNNWSASNIVFGMGGGLLQKINRDTFSFAFKTSSNIIGNNGQWTDVYKNPTDINGKPTGKTSKKGRQMLNYCDNNEFKTVKYLNDESEKNNLLTTVFENGHYIPQVSDNICEFDSIRNKINAIVCNNVKKTSM
jgi:nicotinamide phosphoribosyltransferase